MRSIRHRPQALAYNLTRAAGSGLTLLGVHARLALRGAVPGVGRGRHARAGREGEPQDAGYTTEMILATAALVLIALAVIGVIGAKVMDAANGIDLTP